jgi:hypothetical protein
LRVTNRAHGELRGSSQSAGLLPPLGSDLNIELSDIWHEQQRFGEILERVQTGPLNYRASNNLPFGQQWNTAANYKAGRTGARWAASLPGVKLASTIELPYANASGQEVNAETARAFGRDLARAIRQYLELD